MVEGAGEKLITTRESLVDSRYVSGKFFKEELTTSMSRVFHPLPGGAADVAYK